MAGPAWDEATVVIVGAGPAGSATALRLLQLMPDLTDRVLIVDKGSFPRPKLCGGGLTATSARLVAALEVDIARIAAPVETVEFRLRDRTLRLDAGFWRREQIFRVVDRRVFDHALLETATARGARFAPHFAVTGVSVTPRAVTLTGADDRVVRAEVVVGADGANSVVRRHIAARRGLLGAACEVTVAEGSVAGLARPGTHAVFDFACTRDHDGYYWEFPAPRPGEMSGTSVGIVDARLVARPRPPLSAHLRTVAARHGHTVEAGAVHGAPVRSFERGSRVCGPRVVLVGDALGAEPFFDEGIGSALESACFAAERIANGLACGDLGFNDYRARLGRSDFARALAVKHALAVRFYGGSQRSGYIPVAWAARAVARAAGVKAPTR